MYIFGRQDFVELAITQASQITDEAYVTVSCLHPLLEEFRDDSEEIARDIAGRYSNIHYIENVDVDYSRTYRFNFAHTLNDLLARSDPGADDIIWRLECDEFYPKKAIEEINNSLDNDWQTTTFKLLTKLVVCTWDHFVLQGFDRIFRYGVEGRKFMPSGEFTPDPSPTVMLLQYNTAFNYQMVMPLEYKELLWEVEFGFPTPGQQQRQQIWLEQVYRRYDVNRSESQSHEMNYRLSARKGFWYTNECLEVDGHTVFSSKDAHPSIIEESGIKDRIADIRHHWLYRPVGGAMSTLYGSKDLVGLEIGIARGMHADCLMKNLDIKRLYLVDPFEAYSEGDKVFSKEAVSEYKPAAVGRLRGYSDKLVWIEKKAMDAIDSIEDKSLNFCYIDGDHSYEEVRANLAGYYEKVKPGGLFAGHDYTEGSETGDTVMRAVDEFSRELGVHVNSGLKCDWWVVKDYDLTDPIYSSRWPGFRRCPLRR